MSEVSGVDQSGDHSPGASSQPGVGFAEPGAGEEMADNEEDGDVDHDHDHVEENEEEDGVMMRVKTGGGDNSYLVFSEIRGTPLHSDFTL